MSSESVNEEVEARLPKEPENEPDGFIERFESRFEGWPKWKKVLYTPFWIPGIAVAFVVESVMNSPHAAEVEHQYQRNQLQDQFYREHTRGRQESPSGSNGDGARRTGESNHPDRAGGTAKSARDEIIERAAQILAERSENNRR